MYCIIILIELLNILSYKHESAATWQYERESTPWNPWFRILATSYMTFDKLSCSDLASSCVNRTNILNIQGFGERIRGKVLHTIPDM